MGRKYSFGRMRADKDKFSNEFESGSSGIFTLAESIYKVQGIPPVSLRLDAISSGHSGPDATQFTNWKNNLDSQYASWGFIRRGSGYYEFTIPAGTYTIEVQGACGGAVEDGQNYKNTSTENTFTPTGGDRELLCPAYIKGHFTFDEDTVLLGLIGQAGTSAAYTTGSPSGGGASMLITGGYSTISSAGTNRILAIAGGSGGYGGDSASGSNENLTAGRGQTNTGGGSARTTANSNGTNPNWAGTSSNSGGGASWSTNGDGSTSTKTAAQTTYPVGLKLGGFGANGGAGKIGGWGGGGIGGNVTSSDDDKGGGGGYSGGSEAFDADHCGGGGGSYYSTSNSYFSGTNFTVGNTNTTIGFTDTAHGVIRIRSGVH